MTFYSFHVMVALGCYMLAVFLLTVFIVYRRRDREPGKWICWLFMLGIPVAWICSQAGWIVAEVGRQPWTIQNILPVGGAISDISSTDVQTTFWIFAILFTVLLVAEVSIMLRFINRKTREGVIK